MNDARGDLRAELEWLMVHSTGVLGLRLDGAVTPWHEVRDLYLPSFKFAPPKGSTPREVGADD